MRKLNDVYESPNPNEKIGDRYDRMLGIKELIWLMQLLVKNC